MIGKATVKETPGDFFPLKLTCSAFRDISSGKYLKFLVMLNINDSGYVPIYSNQADSTSGCMRQSDFKLAD